ncbi:MAG: hypothetical protein AB8B77_00405 [Alphaproteobacteria bacterium]
MLNFVGIDIIVGASLGEAYYAVLETLRKDANLLGAAYEPPPQPRVQSPDNAPLEAVSAQQNNASNKASGQLQNYVIALNVTANALQSFEQKAIGLGVTLGAALLPATTKASFSFDGFAAKFPRLSNAMAGTISGFETFNTMCDAVKNASNLVQGGITGTRNTMRTLRRATIASNFQLARQKAIAAGLAAKQIVLGGATRMITAAQWAWNIALNANPLGLIVAGIAAVVGGAYLLYKNWDSVIEWFNKALGKIGDVFSWVGKTWNRFFGKDETKKVTIKQDETKKVTIKPVIEDIGKIAAPAVTAATAVTVGTAAAMTPTANLPINDHINSPANQPQAISAPAQHPSAPARHLSARNTQMKGSNHYQITINTNSNANAQDIAQLVRQEIERMERDHAAKSRGALYDQ